mmetsp:Transcript_519/g.2084  ORF Transcript_519/g.2084 Transcript_519/m.2084 type:complete len:82 (-) Transcript_519:878-1123(-)
MGAQKQKSEEEKIEKKRCAQTLRKCATYLSIASEEYIAFAKSVNFAGLPNSESDTRVQVELKLCDARDLSLCLSKIVATFP